LARLQGFWEWEKHWPLPAAATTPDEIEAAAKLREEMLHKVGNLSLLTKGLNSSISNGPWEKNRDKILEHSALNTNRGFQNVPIWNEALILNRSEELFKQALKLWPRPTAQ
jgi:hypothetical protein